MEFLAAITLQKATLLLSPNNPAFSRRGRFDIKADGNTKLTGGVISSEADPKDNRLETRTLEFEELDTHSE